MHLLNGEAGLLQALVRDPHDEDVRAVYADWLEERGDDRADWLRGDAEANRLRLARASDPDDGAGENEASENEAGENAGEAPEDVAERERELAAIRSRLAALTDVDADWAAAVSRLPIENCDVWSRVIRLQFRCPERWESLQPIVTDGIRFCGACRHHVFYCPTIEAAEIHARAGNRVVVAADVAREPGDLDTVEMMLGELEDSEDWPDGLDRNVVRPLAHVFRAVQRVFTPSDPALPIPHDDSVDDPDNDPTDETLPTDPPP